MYLVISVGLSLFICIVARHLLVHIDLVKLSASVSCSFTGFLILGSISCTPEAVLQDTNEPQARCGDDLPIPPPPPPPPKGGKN